MANINDKPTDCMESTNGDRHLSRRDLLKAVGGSGLLAATAGAGLSGVLFTPSVVAAKEIGPLNPDQHSLKENWVRQFCARQHFLDRKPPQESNSDEELYADKRGSFSKCLPHNDLGEVDLDAYQTLRKALKTGNPADFDAITLSSQAGLGFGQRLVNPQAAYAFEMTGIGGHATRIAPAPAFASAETAAEVAELYWQALTRDVSHQDYASDTLIADAVADLNRLPATVGPKVGGEVTPETLFRGVMPGDLIGPYVSQFLWLTVPYGIAAIEQKYRFPEASVDFVTDYTEWLAIQRGAASFSQLTFDTTPRYILNNRHLAEYVRTDVSFQSFLNAALILFAFGPDALAAGNPYRESFNQAGFATFGLPDIVHLVTKAANTALKSAWYQKWLVHRRLRPEAYAGRVENQRRGAKDYGIPVKLLQSEVVSRTLDRQGNVLLSQAYPSGAPPHPAYPSGHANFTGACATILKALFNEDFVIPDPVQPTTDGNALESITVNLTVGDELNKLVSNICLARDAAGIHYRSDGVQGMLAGEQMAIGILQDYSKTYNEHFPGFTLTKFDGTKVLIVDSKVF